MQRPVVLALLLLLVMLFAGCKKDNARNFAGNYRMSGLSYTINPVNPSDTTLITDSIVSITEVNASTLMAFFKQIPYNKFAGGEYQYLYTSPYDGTYTELNFIANTDSLYVGIYEGSSPAQGIQTYLSGTKIN